MRKVLHSLLLLSIGIGIAVALSTQPTRATDGSKSLSERLNTLEAEVGVCRERAKHLHVTKKTLNGLDGPHVTFDGCNVHVRSGSGDSTDGTVDRANYVLIPNTSPRGLGNIVVGYNEVPLEHAPERTGSHNLIVGPGHNFPSVGSAVFGHENTASGASSSATGGWGNTAQGYASSVSAGALGEAGGYYASVSGGRMNSATGAWSIVSGGAENKAAGPYSSVSGGKANTASGNWASVGGGVENTASGYASSVTGGSANNANLFKGTVSGGTGRSIPYVVAPAPWVAGALMQDK